MFSFFLQGIRSNGVSYNEKDTTAGNISQLMEMMRSYRVNGFGKPSQKNSGYELRCPSYTVGRYTTID